MASPATKLGLRTATLLIVGSSIGSGIFRLPAGMLQQVGSPWLLVGVWVLAGLLSLCGALTFAEMGAMFPKAGGQYVFLRQAFGDRWAFLYGWSFFWVIQTGIIAAVAVAFSGFLAFLWPISAFQQELVAILVIAVLSLVNLFGVRYGGLVSNVFTTLKLAALLALVLLGFVLAKGAGALAEPPAPPSSVGLVGAVGLALAGAFFAFDGWNQSAFVAGEVEEPQKNVPRSMLLGVLVVMAVYVLANVVYLHVLSIGQIVHGGADGGPTPHLASDVAQVLLGPVGATLVTLAILVSTFGTVNAYVLSGPRVYAQMARDGLFYKGLASESARYHVPTFAIIMQAEWAMLLVLTGGYDALTRFSVFAIWFFYGIAGVGLFVLRRKMPDAPRPYRTVGYPLVPILFVATAVFIVVNSLVTDTKNAIFGLLLILSGVPVLAIMEWRRSRAQRAAAAA